MADLEVAGYPFVVEGEEGRRVHVLGNDVVIKISSEATAGAFTVFEGRIKPLEGPPLHRHCYQDEYWRILEGEFRFVVDGQELYARPGDTVFAPRGSAHTFQNIGAGPGRTLTTVVPGGVDVFFEELEMAAPRGSAPDRSMLIALGEKHGHELLGPALAAGTARAAAA